MQRSKISKVREECIANAREHLKRVRRALISEFASDRGAGFAESASGAKDSADLAADEYERHVSKTLRERERNRIAEIDNALRRIDEARYGLCENCGFEIAELRLEALPFARSCYDCQRDQERVARTRRHDDAGRERMAEFASIFAGNEVAQEPARRTENV